MSTDHRVGLRKLTLANRASQRTLSRCNDNRYSQSATTKRLDISLPIVPNFTAGRAIEILQHNLATLVISVHTPDAKAKVSPLTDTYRGHHQSLQPINPYYCSVVFLCFGSLFAMRRTSVAKTGTRIG
ncbi:jg6092 [Pararge aegeria aegeria]|uniref:Jg6092 protein n=1 Tax=Pararge aegeria aegeria TaxID=348720 RepID=A0A8S4S539_9NEOP|nr:jg6092 [Pararge aegeria aegeria]